ncbi:hypothetical protein FQN50_004335 [Emmonsiellopsis sp. PD_5]|nr:hypothetical protein FQN50_004335 [Emmonsiellopsis sp. PD_5]
MRFQSYLLFGALAGAAATALPYGKARRQIDSPPEDREYDFVVVGGGTAGLTIADRLSEAFPDRNVLVIEYGVVEEGSGITEPPDGPPGASRITYETAPIEGLNNRSGSFSIGMTVGGSSAINGQFFDRGSKYDYEEWRAIGSPEFDDSEDKWDWDGIFPWFKKSVLFHEPSDEVVEKYGYTWDVDAAYGGDTPIHSSFPPFQYPLQKIVRDALVEFGVPALTECAAGEKDGFCWVPASQHPETAKRSFAGIGHFADVIEGRSNYDLLVGHKALRLVVDPESDEAPAVEYRAVSDSGENATVYQIQPKLEVIVSAGAIHTPQILQRSGIGDPSFLESAGIEVTVDLPGVGYNFHDHAGPGVSYNYSNIPSPAESDLTTNESFIEEAIELYAQTPAQGPYTLAMENSAIYIPLSNITADYADIAAFVRSQISDGLAASFLPEGTPDTVIAGYEAQLEILANAFEHPKHPVFESPSMGPPSLAFLLKPLSRGTVMIDPENHDAEPIISYRTLSNPIDLDLIALYLQFLRRFHESEGMKVLEPVETAPGANVTDIEGLKEYTRETAQASYMHPCCTAAMMPLEKGGVVGPNLKIHGLDRVRVADISIVPLIPGTHTSATAYAIGEKAADMIIRAWSEAEE